jgi:hypothetical protein
MHEAGTGQRVVVVGCAPKYGRQGVRRFFRYVDIGRQVHTITHGYVDLPRRVSKLAELLAQLLFVPLLIVLCSGDAERQQ